MATFNLPPGVLPLVIAEGVGQLNVLDDSYPGLNRGDRLFTVPCHRFVADDLYVLNLDRLGHGLWRCQANPSISDPCIFVWKDGRREETMRCLSRAEFNVAVIAMVAGWMHIRDRFKIYEDDAAGAPLPTQPPMHLHSRAPALIDLPLLTAPTPGNDTKLLALCRRYMSFQRRQRQLADALLAANDAGDKEREDYIFGISRRFIPYGHELLAEVMDCAATTPAGLRAKAEVAATRVDHNNDGCPMFEDMPLWSLCQDLLASRGPSA